MQKIAAIYARYSTDLQNDKSIDDQVTLCRHIASRNGFVVSDDLIFPDRASAITATGVSSRQLNGIFADSGSM